MRNIFQANILFYILVFFCALFIMSQFSIEAFASEPSKVSHELRSGSDVVRDRSLNTPYLILKVGFKHCSEFLESMAEFGGGFCKDIFFSLIPNESMSCNDSKKSDDNTNRPDNIFTKDVAHWFLLAITFWIVFRRAGSGQSPLFYGLGK